MEDIDKTKEDITPFSLFLGGIKTTIPSKEISLFDFIETIKSDKYKEKVLKLREIKDEMVAKLFKNTFDFVISTGNYSTRAKGVELKDKLKTPSCLASLDIDDLPGADYEGLKNIITEDKHIAAVFNSPRKKLKAFFRIPYETDNHSFRCRWYAATKHFAKSWGIKDTDFDGLKDMARACYVSWDPNAYCNPSAEVFEGFEEIKDTERDKPSMDYKQVYEKGVTEGNRNESLLRLACSMVHKGVEKPHVLETLNLTNKKNNPPLPADEIHTILENAFGYKKEEEQPIPIEPVIEENIVIKEVSEILVEDTPKPKFRIEKIIPESGVTYIAAPPGEGKSLLANHIAQSIAAGSAFFDLEVLPGKVIYFDAENGEICVYDRTKRIAAGNDFGPDDLKDFKYSIFPNIRFDIESRFYADFLAFFDKHKPDVVIFDSLVRFMDGSENDAESCKKVFDSLRHLLKNYPHLSIIILHHVTKLNEGGMNALRGSSELAAAASSILMIKRKGAALKLSIEKSRYIDMSQGFSIYYKMIDEDDKLIFELASGSDIPADAQGMAEADFWVWVNESKIESFRTLNAQNHLKSKGHNKSAVYRMIGNLLDNENIVKISHGLYEIKNNPITIEEEVKDE